MEKEAKLRVGEKYERNISTEGHWKSLLFLSTYN